MGGGDGVGCLRVLVRAGVTAGPWHLSGCSLAGKIGRVAECSCGVAVVVQWGRADVESSRPAVTPRSLSINWVGSSPAEGDCLAIDDKHDDGKVCSVLAHVCRDEMRMEEQEECALCTGS